MKEKKESFIPHYLLNVSEGIDKDPVLIECCRLLFDWANKQGLKGREVKDLVFIPPSENDPFNTYNRFFCKIVCSEEERLRWEKGKEMQCFDYIAKLFKDD